MFSILLKIQITPVDQHLVTIMAPNMNNKKRSAPPHGSSDQSKKPRFNDSKPKSKTNAKDFKGKGKAPVTNKKPIKSHRSAEEKVVAAPRRKLPLTATGPAPLNDDDDDEMDVDESEEESEDVEMEEEVNDNEPNGEQSGEPKQRMSKGKPPVFGYAGAWLNIPL